MKKTVITVLICVLTIATSFAKLKKNAINSTIKRANDTIKINSSNLISNEIALGKSNYVIYFKKDKKSIAMDLSFVEIEVLKEKFNNTKVYKITQKWSEKDTLIHTSETILKEDNLETLYHKTWWKRDNQITEVDYMKKIFSVTGDNEKFNKKVEEGLNASFSDPNFINWHTDLHLFSLLPFKNEAIYKIKVYDPGYSVPKEEVYTVIGSEKVEGNDCWILNFELPNKMGYQRFWISKSERIVIKVEDSFRGIHRFKLKTKVAE